MLILASMSTAAHSAWIEESQSLANDFIAFNIGRYPVHLQMFPSNVDSTFSCVGEASFSSKLK